jgi:protein TonB
LPAALIVHAFALGAVAVGQLWAVDHVPEPETAVTFVTLPPPPPPVGSDEGRGSRQHSDDRRTAHHQPVQPRSVPDTAAKRLEPATEPGDGKHVPGGDPEGSEEGVIGGVLAETPAEPLPTEPEPVIPVRLAGTAPVPLARPAPGYPELARRARVEGTVVLEAVIDRNGDVVDVQIVKDVRLGCGEAAREAVRSWRYLPATLNGRPVSVMMTVTVTFELRGAS